MSVVPLSAYDTSREFLNSDAAKERRSMRRTVRDLGLSKNDQEILQFLVNMWFSNRYVAGEIHPGRERVSKKVRLSVRTVARALAKFRDCGFLVPVQYAKGGRKSTRYTVNFVAIIDAANGVESAEGGLQPVAKSGPLERATDTHIDEKPCQIGTRIKNKGAKGFCLGRSGSTRQAEVIKPAAFSPWKGTARSYFQGWLEDQNGFSGDEARFLHFLSNNICPDWGVCDFSDRFFSKALGISRRQTAKIIFSLAEAKIIQVDTTSRMRRGISSGMAMDILRHAPGLPF